MWGGSSACATLRRYVLFVQDCKLVRKRGEGEEQEACSVHDFTNSTYAKGGVKLKRSAKTSDHMLKLVVSCYRLSLK